MINKKEIEKYRFVLLVVLFICIFQFFSSIFIYSSTGEDISKHNYIEKYEQVHISRGDTLWEIAKKYKPKNKSINKYVSYIKEFNHMKSNDIYAGDTLIIPVYNSIE